MYFIFYLCIVLYYTSVKTFSQKYSEVFLSNCTSIVYVLYMHIKVVLVCMYMYTVQETGTFCTCTNVCKAN